MSWQGGDVRFSDFFTSFAINVKSSEGDKQIKRMSDLLILILHSFRKRVKIKQYLQN